jgi:hypothetical protein
MRLHLLLGSTALLWLSASPLALRAQFQDPTPDELKMTSDPKAPGAAAVYLYREATTDNDRFQSTYYARIKVLTEKGKELATVRIPYEPGYLKVKIDGRTIHSDGTIVAANAKPEDLVTYKSKYLQENAAVLILPDVEIGSILEYRVQFSYNYGIPPPTWDLQEAYFIHKEHFLFNVGTGLVVKDQLGRVLDRLMCEISPPGVPVHVNDNRGVFTVELADVPPLVEEDWMPPSDYLRWRAAFYYSFALSNQEYWEKEAKYWAEETDTFAKVTGTIKNAADSIVSSGDTDEQKARKIYAAVMKLENTDFTHVKSEAELKKDKLKEIHSVEDVWKNQGGAGNSIALLYVALARAAGLKAWPIQIVDRNRGMFNSQYLDVKQLNDYLAIVNIGGKDIFLDPAQKMCPFGVLRWSHTLAGGIRESDSGPIVAQTPGVSYVQNNDKTSADLTIDASGNVTGSARFFLGGADALYWRQRALQYDLEDVKQQFIETLRDDLPDGAEAKFDHFLGLEDPEVNLIAIVNLGGHIGSEAGKRLILPGLLFQSRAKHPFVSQDQRTAPIDIHFPMMEVDDVTYTLPPGYGVESAPHTDDTNWPGSAVLRINSVAKDNTLEVGRVFARNFTMLNATDYNDLHDFYLKLAAADQQQIVLSRTASSKGNQP